MDMTQRGGRELVGLFDPSQAGRREGEQEYEQQLPQQHLQQRQHLLRCTIAATSNSMLRSVPRSVLCRRQ
jgi:hypothetical protein